MRPQSASQSVRRAWARPRWTPSRWPTWTPRCCRPDLVLVSAAADAGSAIRWVPALDGGPMQRAALPAGSPQIGSLAIGDGDGTPDLVAISGKSVIVYGNAACSAGCAGNP